LEREAEDVELEAKNTAKHGKEKTKNKLTKSKQAAQDNPVALGNAVIVGVLGTVLGIGAYRKYAAGEFSWRVAGIWAGVVGVFAAADYWATSFLYKKYPPKK